MTAKTVLVCDPDLFDEFFDVFIQGIPLSLHGQDDGDQFLTAHGIQFVRGMLSAHRTAPLLPLLYYRHDRKANPSFAASGIMPMPQAAQDVWKGMEKYKVFKARGCVCGAFLTVCTQRCRPHRPVMPPRFCRENGQEMFLCKIRCLCSGTRPGKGSVFKPHIQEAEARAHPEQSFDAVGASAAEKK